MPNRQKEKGSRYERAVVAMFNFAGFSAERVPLSGACGGRYSSDVETAWFDGEAARFECKSRADSFKQIYKWIGGNTGLFFKADRREALVVLRSKDFFDLMRRAHGRENQRDMEAELDRYAEGQNVEAGSGA